MDKADLALIISILSAVGATGSAIFTWRLAQNDSKRMMRKPLVFEVSLRPVDEQPDWQGVYIVVRNLEPVAAEIKGVYTRRRGVLLLSSEDAYDRQAFPPAFRSPLPVEKARQGVALRASVGPQGSQSEYSPGTVYRTVYLRGAAKPSDIKVDWVWADGLKE